jgi:Uma2 family endonuclease
LIQANPKLLNLEEFIAQYGNQNDYARKAEDYALLGVPEYWITDYFGLGGRDYIGKPKQPIITLCQLADDVYEKRLFRQDDTLVSAIFPELRLQAEAIFAATQLSQQFHKNGIS